MVRGKPVLVALMVITLLLAACGNAIEAPRQVGVPFPANYRETFVQYATVERPDGVIRDFYIHPDALLQVRSGYALPEGTILVVEAYDGLKDADGKLIKDTGGHFVKGTMHPEIHIAEKRPNWQPEDFESGQLSDDWNFGSFTASGELFKEPLTPCFNCHNTTERLDFVWSLPMLWRYHGTGKVQYGYCNATGRSPCDL